MPCRARARARAERVLRQLLRALSNKMLKDLVVNIVTEGEREGEGMREREGGVGAVVGMGACCIDYLAGVASYPKPDEKIRSESFKTEGGGNAGNAMTCLARLVKASDETSEETSEAKGKKGKKGEREMELDIRVVSKVGSDAAGSAIVDGLEAEGIDCSQVKRGEGTSAFTYIIVDVETKTRTCVHTPLHESLRKDEIITEKNVEELLESCQLLYCDGRHTDVALELARAAQEKGIPILVDAEKPRPLLRELLECADIVVTSETFPVDFGSQLSRRGKGEDGEVGGGSADFVTRMVSLADQMLPKAKLVIVTRGGRGSIALAKPGGLVKDINISNGIGPQVEESIIANDRLEEHELELGGRGYPPEVRLPQVRDVGDNVLIASSSFIPNVEDTTGAGDAFIGSLCFALTMAQAKEASLRQVITFASLVAGLKCRAVGARSGLPRRRDLPVDELLFHP